MKSAEDFRKDFGQADERFCRCAKAALSELTDEPKIRVRRIRWGATVAFVLVLMGMTAAVAAKEKWGILEFVNRDGYWGNARRTANEGAGDIVYAKEFLVSVNDGVAEYTVTQSAHDGMCTYLTVHARPIKENLLLLGECVLMGNSTLFLNKEGLGDEMTISEYCVQQGLEGVKVIFGGMECLDMTLNEDGSTTFMLVQDLLASGQGHHPDVWVHAGKDVKPVMLSYHVSVGKINERYISTNSTDFGGFLSEPCTVEVVRTEMTNYLIIRHPKTDASGDTAVHYEVMIDGEVAGDGAIDLGVTFGDSTVLTFAAETIGDELIVLATLRTYGEPVEAADDDGDTTLIRYSIDSKTAQHTFSLKRAE